MRALAIGRVGVDLSELCVGTSAIGAVLAEHAPVWLHRHEHFLTTCVTTAAPVPPSSARKANAWACWTSRASMPERPELLHLALRCSRAIEDRLLRTLPHALLLHVNWPARWARRAKG